MISSCKEKGYVWGSNKYGLVHTGTVDCYDAEFFFSIDNSSKEGKITHPIGA